MHFCQTTRPITKFGTLTKNKGQMHFCQTTRPITKLGTLTKFLMGPPKLKICADAISYRTR